jgi:hypothetical protein
MRRDVGIVKTVSSTRADSRADVADEQAPSESRHVVADSKMLLANLPWEPIPHIVRTPPHRGKGTAQRLALLTSRIGAGEIQSAHSPKHDLHKRSVALSESSPATSWQAEMLRFAQDDNAVPLWRNGIEGSA